MNEQSKALNYYMVIPAQVAYNNDLAPIARLIFGELHTMANTYQHVFISNAGLAERFGISKRTVSRYISELEKVGYISTEITFKEGTKEIERREIFIAESVKLL